MIRINRFGFMAHSEWQLTTHPPTRLVHSRIYSVSWLHGRRRYYITGHRRSRRIPPRQGARWHQVILISNRLLLSSDASHLVKKLVYSPTNLAKPKILLWFFSGFDKKKEVKLYKKKEEKKSICNLGLSGLSPRYANETRGREHLGSKGALCINLPPFHVLSHLPGILTLTFYLQYKTIFV